MRKEQTRFDVYCILYFTSKNVCSSQFCVTFCSPGLEIFFLNDLDALIISIKTKGGRT